MPCGNAIYTNIKANMGFLLFFKNSVAV
jgi:hypothetical protein